MRRWKIRFLAAVLTGAMVLGTPASALADVETLSDRNERYEEQERGTDLLSEGGEGRQIEKKQRRKKSRKKIKKKIIHSRKKRQMKSRILKKKIMKIEKQNQG